MRDLVLIPSYYRPEFLHVCLEYLLQARGGADKEVWIAQDMKTNDIAADRVLLMEIIYVAKQFEGKFKTLRYIQRVPNQFNGNCYNFLELYKAAFAQQDVRYVYLIEDDVLVGPDFFEWHEAVQARGNYFCTVGWHCTRNPNVKATDNPNVYIETNKDFSSQGVCWKRQSLAHVVRHATPEYYQRPSAYMLKNFPGNPIPHGQWTEQAGLIMRILLQDKTHTVAWAGLRRCSHVGLNGYHRRAGFKFKGTLASKVDQLHKAINTGHLIMIRRVTDDDVEIPVAVGEWKSEDLRMAQKFLCDGTTGLGKI